MNLFEIFPVLPFLIQKVLLLKRVFTYYKEIFKDKAEWKYIEIL